MTNENAFLLSRKSGLIGGENGESSLGRDRMLEDAVFLTCGAELEAMAKRARADFGNGNW